MTNEKTNGFTLVEVIIGFFLISALGLAVLNLNTALSQTQILAWQNYLNVDQTNAYVANLVRELRTARPADNGAYPLETVNDQEISFFCDFDFDGKTEKIRYFITDTQLFKGITKPSGYPIIYPPTEEKLIKLTDYVRNGSNPLFTYYNGDWPADQINNPLTLQGLFVI
jgi:type II secretory pathway pseudopilin PulG